MASGKDIRTAVQQHNSVALRKMAEQATKEATRMLLTLLADFVERDRKKLKKTA